MGAAPRMARRIPHNRLFGAGIVAAGLALVLVALAPHLFLAIAAVMLVGGVRGHRVPHRAHDHRHAGRRRDPRPGQRVRPDDRAAHPARLALDRPADRRAGGHAHDRPGHDRRHPGRHVRGRSRRGGRRLDRLPPDGRPAHRPDAARPARRTAPGRAARGHRPAGRGRRHRRGGGGRRRPPGWPSACAPRATPSSRSKAGPPIASGGRRRCGRRRCRGPARGRWPRRRSWPTRSSAWCGPRSRRARWSSPTGSWPCRWPSSASRRTASDPGELEDLAVWATGRLRPDVSVLLDRAPVGGAPPGVRAGG